MTTPTHNPNPAQRWIFPFFNAILLAGLGYGLSLLLGYRLWWIIGGAIGGLLFAVLLEVLAYNRGWYRGRLYLAVLLEVPFILFVLAPYVFVITQTQPLPTTICCSTPADFGAVDYETVMMPMRDDVRLSGWYVPPPDEGDALIILLHGIGDNRLLTRWHAAQLYQAGYGVLMYDQRAMGASEGATRSFGWLDQDDLSDVIDWVLAQGDVDPDKIGAVGLSLGGHIALPTAGKDPRLRAIWVDGVAIQHARDFPNPQTIGERIEQFYQGLLDLALTVYTGQLPDPIIDHAPRIAPRPVYLVAGEATEFEARASRRYAEAIGTSATLWVVDGGGHVNAHRLYPDDYRQRMIDFFNAAFAD